MWCNIFQLVFFGVMFTEAEHLPQTGTNVCSVSYCYYCSLILIIINLIYNGQFRIEIESSFPFFHYIIFQQQQQVTKQQPTYNHQHFQFPPVNTVFSGQQVCTVQKQYLLARQ